MSSFSAKMKKDDGSQRQKAGSMRTPMWRLAFSFWLLALPGCAALTNPVGSGIPVRRLPLEVLGESRELEQTIPEKFLVAPRQDPYLITKGDILGVFIKSVTGDEKASPPVVTLPDSKLPPAIGYPFVVREDGTVSLPLAPAPIKVGGMSLADAEKEIRKYYIDIWKILLPENANIIVTMQKQHVNNIYVVRQDAGGILFGSSGFNNTKRGTATVLELQANESDVASALNRTGGLPGLDARNEVVVFRGIYKPERDGILTMPDLKHLAGGKTAMTRDKEGNPGLEIIRIPLRLKPGQKVPFTPEDVRLSDGDVVFIETRETELYYTGGILPQAEILLPRDYDLDVLEAVAQVRGPLFNGGFAGTNFNGSSVGAGLGTPNPTHLSVIRRWEGKQIVINVDLAKAAVDPRERINVKPGDFLILQETYGEAFIRYLTQVTTFNSFSPLLSPNTRSSIDFIGRTP